MNLPLFLAKRIYQDKGDRRKVSRPAIHIATAGIAIGLAVMIITTSVVLGFKHTIRDKVAGFGSHIQVRSLMAINSAEEYPICMDDSLMARLSAIEGIKHVQRYATAQGILKTDDDFLGVAFKGIGPEYDQTFLQQNMVEGELPKFSDTKSQNRIVISKTIADKLHLKTGQKIYAYFIDEDGVRPRRFTISGIYQTNLSYFDKTICLTDLYTAVRLNGFLEGQCSGAELIVNNFDQLEQTSENVISKVGRTLDRYQNSIGSQTILEAYPQIFTWLQLLDVNVWIILGLMLCLASITMISGLLIIILERTTMIGILKALGARNSCIRHTFLWFAAFIISRGLLLGDIIAIGLIVLQQLTGLVTLDPQTYYVSQAPVEFNLPIIIALNIGTLLISIVVLIAPSYFISHIHPAKSMRYE